MFTQLTPYGIISFANFFFTLLLGCLAIAKAKKNPVKISYGIFAFTLAFYALFYFLWQSTDNDDIGILFFKWTIVGVVLINTALVQFTYSLLNLHRTKQVHLVVIHTINFFFCIAALNLFYEDWQIKYSYGLWPIPSKIFHIYLVWWFLQVFYCFYLIWEKGIHKASGKQKYQCTWVLTALCIGYVGGATNWLVWYGYPFPPYLNGGVAIYAIVLGYAILRHQLLDIEIIIKRTLVFAGLFAMVMAIVAIVSAVTQGFLGRYLAVPPMISTMISVAMALLCYNPARRILVNVTDRYLFQKKEDIKVILNKLSKDIITMLDIEAVGKKILSTLESSFRPQAGLLLIKNEAETGFEVHSSFGLSNPGAVYPKEEPIIQFFSQYDNIVNLEADVEKQTPAVVRQKMAEFKAVMAIPLFIHIELIGVLFLGPKKSDEEYTQEELDLFPTMASQVAVAVSNARLYDKLKKSQIDFAQQAKMAAIGTLSAGISHEIKNPLNHIRVGISMLRMNKKHGVLDQLDRQKMEDEVFKTLEILDENVTRANEVIERLSSFAKKPKELSIGPVDLRKAVDMALSFLEAELKNYEIAVEKDFPENFPEIKADLHTLEDIFLNLFVNARHAIGDKGMISVKGIISPGQVEVIIRDTGKGIAEENLGKVFDPFFTTKDVSRNTDKGAVKGSGLGLFIVREFIQRFGGTITVKSELGKGTAFHIAFPETVWAG